MAEQTEGPRGATAFPCTGGSPNCKTYAEVPVRKNAAGRVCCLDCWKAIEGD